MNESGSPFFYYTLTHFIGVDNEYGIFQEKNITSTY